MTIALTDSPLFRVADGRPYRVAPSGVHYHPDTAPAVAAALDTLIRSQKAVRVFLGDTTTGEAWAEEHDCHGTLGNSTGPLKAPLLIAPRAEGGPHLIDQAIVAIKTKNAWAYRHPTLNLGTWTVGENDGTTDHKGKPYAAVSLHNGTVHGRHTSRAAAQRLVDFMRGERMTP